MTKMVEGTVMIPLQVSLERSPTFLQAHDFPKLKLQPERRKPMSMTNAKYSFNFGSDMKGNIVKA